MSKIKKPIDLVDRLREKYKKEAAKTNSNSQDTWLNIKSILYTSLIAVAIAFVIVSGVVLIPLAILLIIGLIIFMIVKAALSEKDIDTDKDN